jgi:transcriptional regulator with XRE-family HTH domain
MKSKGYHGAGGQAMATFGERLRDLREDNDQTQAQLGELLNIGARMISHYEKDEHFPGNPSTIIKLAKHFKVSCDYLLGNSDHKNNAELEPIIKTYFSLSREARQAVNDFISFQQFKDNEKKKEHKQQR